MTYALSAPLQTAIYQHLQGDAALAELVQDAIFDALPAGTRPETYVSLGPETVRDQSSKSGAGARHLVTISVISDAAGFATLKAVAGAVCDALQDATLSLSRGHLIGLYFDRATARRVQSGSTRRIDLRFTALVEDDALSTPQPQSSME